MSSVKPHHELAHQRRKPHAHGTAQTTAFRRAWRRLRQVWSRYAFVTAVIVVAVLSLVRYATRSVETEADVSLQSDGAVISVHPELAWLPGQIGLAAGEKSDVTLMASLPVNQVQEIIVHWPLAPQGFGTFVPETAGVAARQVDSDWHFLPQDQATFTTSQPVLGHLSVTLPADLSKLVLELPVGSVRFVLAQGEVTNDQVIRLEAGPVQTDNGGVSFSQRLFGFFVPRALAAQKMSSRDIERQLFHEQTFWEKERDHIVQGFLGQRRYDWWFLGLLTGLLIWFSVRLVRLHKEHRRHRRAATPHSAHPASPALLEANHDELNPVGYHLSSRAVPVTVEKESERIKIADVAHLTLTVENFLPITVSNVTLRVPLPIGWHTILEEILLAGRRLTTVSLERRTILVPLGTLVSRRQLSIKLVLYHGQLGERQLHKHVEKEESRLAALPPPLPSMPAKEG